MNSLSATDISLTTNHPGHNLLDYTEKMSHGDMPDWGYTLTAAVLFSIGFFGFSLNLFVIIIMCKDIQVSFQIKLFVGFKSKLKIECLLKLIYLWKVINCHEKNSAG